MLIAGDDADAKASVSAFIESLGLRPLDTGDLAMAHWLEGTGLLLMGSASTSLAERTRARRSSAAHPGCQAARAIRASKQTSDLRLRATGRNLLERKTRG